VALLYGDIAGHPVQFHRQLWPTKFAPRRLQGHANPCWQDEVWETPDRRTVRRDDPIASPPGRPARNFSLHYSIKPPRDLADRVAIHSAGGPINGRTRPRSSGEELLNLPVLEQPQHVATSAPTTADIEVLPVIAMYATEVFGCFAECF